MIVRKITILGCLGMLSIFTTNAQLFETRSTNYDNQGILNKLDSLGSEEQFMIRDSIIEARAKGLSLNDTLETFFDDYHLGMVIYRDSKPFELIGFWDPQGKPVKGGELNNGNGNIQTPFNKALIQNFTSESVVYVSGMKKGKVFYYCDCANVLRKGKFVNNQKSGLWEEFAANGSFIKQRRLKIIKESIEEEIKPIDIDYRQPAHCMMRNPDEKIVCPKG